MSEQRIVPMIAYEDAAGAIDWLCDAFGFIEDADQRYTEEDGTVTHAELSFDGGSIMLATPNNEYRNPKHHREECEAARRWLDNPYVIDGLHVRVDDLDAHYERAKAKGATILREPYEPGVGFRLYSAEDPEGHRWMFAQPSG
ncbi:MAG: VOC family protein [Actinobacteria bacterium]|nr:VOC family protein [Actinomycetota bacterium]